MKKLLFFAVIILGFSAVSFGQSTSTVTSSASATILASINISNTTPLNFGTVGAKATTSTVVLATDDSRTASTATLFGVGAPAKAGVFGIVGTPLAAFTIVLPTAPVVLTGPSAATMTINSTDWVSDLGSTSALSGTGTQTLKVGTTLQVGINQTAGTYTGSYAVTVNYN